MALRLISYDEINMSLKNEYLFKSNNYSSTEIVPNFRQLGEIFTNLRT